MSTTLKIFLRAPKVVIVRLAKVRGSSPRAQGTEMFVTPKATHGTIGGGQLEYMALDQARALLASGEVQAQMDVPLGPEIGQCCGGRVEISLTVMSAADKDAAMKHAEAEANTRPCVHIFGAGHVGRALAQALALLPLQVRLIDNRSDELALSSGDVAHCLTALPEAELRAAPAGSAFVILTHDHATDFLLASEALARGNAAYVGMIGSVTKRATFERWLAREMPRVSVQNLACPMARDHREDKRPEVLASFIAAEVMSALSAAKQHTKETT